MNFLSVFIDDANDDLLKKIQVVLEQDLLDNQLIS
jgi:hypothetical protein